MGESPMVAFVGDTKRWVLNEVLKELSGLSAGNGGGRWLVVLGLGGGFGGVWCWCLDSRCCFSLVTSSEVNWMVEVLPPRNFSQPGAP